MFNSAHIEVTPHDQTRVTVWDTPPPENGG